MKSQRLGDGSNDCAIKNIPFLKDSKKRDKKRKKARTLCPLRLWLFSFLRSDMIYSLLMLHFVFQLIIHFLPINASAGNKATGIVQSD